MATVPISSDNELIRQILTDNEIKELGRRGLYIDTDSRTLWTKTDTDELVRLGGGRKVDISLYPGLGEALDTELPLQPNTIAGNPETPVQVMNHLYARATAVVTPVLNPRVLISNPTVDKVADTITFTLEFIDFRDIQIAAAYLSVSDELDDDVILLGPVISQAEDDPDPAPRSVTVPITEFSEVRNRLYVWAQTTREENFFSNKLTLDVVALPPEPGVITVNSYAVENGWVNANMTFERLDYINDVYLMFRGTAGYTQSASRIDVSADGTIDISTPFDYDGEGTVEITVHGVDLNGEPVVSAPFIYQYPESDLQVISQAYDSATGLYTAQFGGTELEADSRVYLQVLYDDAYSNVVQKEFIASGNEVAVSIPLYPSKASTMKVRYQCTDVDGRNRYIYSQILLNGERALPSFELGEYDSFNNVRRLTVYHQEDGQTLRAGLEYSLTRSGDYVVMPMGIENMLITDSGTFTADVNFSPMNGTYFIRPYVELTTGVVRGPEVQVTLDSHELYFYDGDLRLADGKLLGLLDSNVLIDLTTPVALYVSESSTASKEDYDLIYSGSISDLSDDSISSTIITASYSADVVYVYAVIDSDLGQYTTRTSRLITNPSEQPLPTVNVTSILLDDETGERIIEGTLTGLDRPDEMIMTVIDGEGNDVTSTAFMVEWSDNEFIGRAYITPSGELQHMNGNFDIRISGRATASTMETWNAPLWRHVYFNNTYFHLTAIKFDLPRGEITFDASHGGIDLTADMKCVVSDGNVSRELTFLGGDDRWFDRKRWVMDESFSGPLSFTVSVLSKDGYERSSVILHDAVLPHTLNDGSLQADPVEISPYSHTADTGVDESAYGDAKDLHESHWILKGEGVHERVATTSQWMGFDLLDYPYGSYEIQRRLVTDDGKVHVVDIPFDYTDSYYRLVSVNTGDAGDMLVVPVINESLNRDGIVMLPATWTVTRTGQTVEIDLPENYSVESGTPGVYLETFNFDTYGGRHLSATIDGTTIYAKLEVPELINTARIVGIQQAGRTVDVQWRLRADVTDEVLTGRSIILKVQDQSGASTEFDITPSGELTYLTTASVTLPDTIIGQATFTLVIRTLPSTDYPASIFKYVLTDKAYMDILESNFEGSDDLIIQVLSDKVVGQGQYAPRITLKTVDLVSPVTLLDNVLLTLEEGITSVHVGGLTGVDMVVAQIQYESVSGEVRTFTRRIAREGLSDVFRDVSYDRESNKNQVTVKGILAATRRSDVLTLQSRISATQPWSNRPFLSAVDKSVTPETGFVIDALRRDGFPYTGESPFGEYRLSALTEEGRMYSEAAKVATGPAIFVEQTDFDPGDDLNDPISKVDLLQRGIDFTAPGTFKDSNGLIIDLASELARFSSNKPQLLNLMFFNQVIAEPFTIRMHDTDGNRLHATYPADATPLVLPETMLIKDVRYIVSDDELTLYLAPVVNLIGFDATTVQVSINSAEPVALAGEVIDLGNNDYRVKHAVADIGQTSIEVFVDDLADNSYSLEYVLTGDEPVDGEWGAIEPLTISEVELTQDPYGTSYMLEFVVMMDETIASSSPTAVLVADSDVTSDSATVTRIFGEANKYTVQAFVSSFEFTTFTLKVTADNGVKRLEGDYTLTGSEPHVGKPVAFTMSDVNYYDDLPGEEDRLRFNIDLAGAYRTDTYLFVNGSQVSSAKVGVVSNNGESLTVDALLPNSITGWSDITSINVKTRTLGEENYYAPINLDSGITIHTVPTPADGATEQSLTGVVYKHRFEDNTEVTEFSIEVGSELDISSVVVKIDGGVRPLIQAPELTVASPETYKFIVNSGKLDVDTVSIEYANTTGDTFYANHITEGSELEAVTVTPTTITDVSYSQKTNGTERMLHGKINATNVRNTKTFIVVDESGTLEFVPLISYDTDGYADFTFPLVSRPDPIEFRIVAEDANGDVFEGSYTMTGSEPVDLTDAVSINIDYVEFYEFEGQWSVYAGIDYADIDTAKTRMAFDSDELSSVGVTSELYEGTMEISKLLDPNHAHSTMTIEVTANNGQVAATSYTFTGNEAQYPETPAPSKSIGDFEILSPNLSGDNLAVIVKPYTGSESATAYIMPEAGKMPLTATITDNGDGTAIVMATGAEGANVTNLFSVTVQDGADSKTATYFYGEVPTLPVPLGEVVLDTTGEFTVLSSEVIFDGGYYLALEVSNTTVAGNTADWSTATVAYIPSDLSETPVFNAFDMGTESMVMAPLAGLTAGDVLGIAVTTNAGTETGQIGLGEGTLQPAEPVKTAGDFAITDVNYTNEGGQDYLNFTVSEDPSTAQFFGISLPSGDGAFNQVTEPATLTDGKWVSRYAIAASDVNMSQFAMMMMGDTPPPKQAIYVTAGIPNLPLPYGTQSFTSDGQMTIFNVGMILDVVTGNFFISIAADSTNVDLATVQFQTGPEGPQDALAVTDYGDGSFALDIPLSAYPPSGNILVVANNTSAESISTLVTIGSGDTEAAFTVSDITINVFGEESFLVGNISSSNFTIDPSTVMVITNLDDQPTAINGGAMDNGDGTFAWGHPVAGEVTSLIVFVSDTEGTMYQVEVPANQLPSAPPPPPSLTITELYFTGSSDPWTLHGTIQGNNVSIAGMPMSIASFYTSDAFVAVDNKVDNGDGTVSFTHAVESDMSTANFTIKVDSELGPVEVTGMPADFAPQS